MVELKSDVDLRVGFLRGEATNIIFDTPNDVLELNCWTLGDDFDRFFPVKIVNSEQVSTLREVIKGEKKLKFDGSPPLPYSNLWKVQIDLNNADEEYLKEIKVNVQRRCPGC